MQFTNIEGHGVKFKPFHSLGLERLGRGEAIVRQKIGKYAGRTEPIHEAKDGLS